MGREPAEAKAGTDSGMALESVLAQAGMALEDRVVAPVPAEVPEDTAEDQATELE